VEKRRWPSPTSIGRQLDIPPANLYGGPDFKEKHRCANCWFRPRLPHQNASTLDVNGDGGPIHISSFLDTKSATKTGRQKAGPRTLEKARPHRHEAQPRNEWTESATSMATGPRAHSQFMERNNPCRHKLAEKNEAGEPILKPWVITEAGKLTTATAWFRDINGDGLEDIIYGNLVRTPKNQRHLIAVINSRLELPHASADARR